MGRFPGLARRFFDRFEPVHAVTYFAAEPRAALEALGYPGFWMGYFAARSAPLGIVPAEVVAATFYNFTPERVAKALPAAWDKASPAGLLTVRTDSAVAALRRSGVTDSDATRQAAELAAKAAGAAPLDGDGELTDAGRAVKQQIEDRTDTLALHALDALTDDEVTTLFRVLTPITRLVVAAGDVPAATPMGLNRNDLDDDRAHLG